VGLGAIVVVEVGRGGFGSAVARADHDALLTQSLACVDVLGRSTVDRTIEQLVRADVDVISVLLCGRATYQIPDSAWGTGKVQVQRVADASAAIAEKVAQFSHAGIAHSFVMSASIYAETDLLDFFYFHREAKQKVTRARDHEGFLNLWVVNCARVLQSDLDGFAQAKSAGSTYYVGGYVRRLNHPQDLRRLASDALMGRCALRPEGQAIRPGIWVDEGAEIDKRARIVAPAYIGRGACISEDALITRCSSVEEGCSVECGTVVEDSSLLPHSHVGIWLDVCHAVVNGNKMWSLEHEVLLEISDPSILRSTRAAGKKVAAAVELVPVRRAAETVVPLQQDQSSEQEAWRFGANLIQG